MNLQKIFEKTWKPVYIVPLIVFTVVVAFFDVLGFQMFQTVADPGPIYQQMVDKYMQLFHGLLYTFIAGSTILVLIYKDLDNALAYLVFSLAVIWSGVWDFLYYQFPSTPSMPETLTHLNGTPVGTMAKVFNNGVVTEKMLFLNIIVFLTIGFILSGWVRYGKELSFLDQY